VGGQMTEPRNEFDVRTELAAIREPGKSFGLDG
jgi:hypothetical protein